MLNQLRTQAPDSGHLRLWLTIEKWDFKPIEINETNQLSYDKDTFDCIYKAGSNTPALHMKHLESWPHGVLDPMLVQCKRKGKRCSIRITRDSGTVLSAVYPVQSCLKLISRKYCYNTQVCSVRMLVVSVIHTNCKILFKTLAIGIQLHESTRLVKWTR